MEDIPFARALGSVPRSERIGSKKGVIGGTHKSVIGGTQKRDRWYAKA